MEEGQSEVRASGHVSSGRIPAQTLTGGVAMIAAAAIVLLAAATMVAVATGYNPEARRLPILVGTPVAIFAAAELLTCLRKWRRSRTAGAPAFRTPSRDTWVPVGYLAAFVLLFVVFGQILGTWIFTVGFVRAQRAMTWRGALIMGSVLVVSLWGIASVLDVRTYAGILGIPL